MNIPINFQQKIIGAFGDEGKKWIATLEDRAHRVMKEWDLTFESIVSNLSYNYVINVSDSNGTPLILKIGVPNFDFQNEINCLMAYAGNGCVKILKADAEEGAMILERLIPGRMLSDFKVQEEQQTIQHFIKVWKGIRRPLPEGVSFTSIMNWADGLKRYEQSHSNKNALIPLELIDLAKDYFQEIAETSSGNELLHGDLHHENILFSEELGWMAIDPKGVAGDSYFDVVSFLINQLHNRENPKERLELRINMVCDDLSFNRERLLKAAIALGTLYACWGIEDQDPDWENTYECVQWFQEFKS